MSVLSGVKSRAAVCKTSIERFIGKTFVRIFGLVPTVAGAGEKPVQFRGGTVGEATAITELVVVEALRKSNSLCEAIGQPPLDMAGVRKREIL